jgi:hypothetical protein
MAALISEGEWFEVGDVDVEVPFATVSIGDVHPVHLAGGLMNMWVARYARLADRPDLEVVQVLIEPSRHQPRLDRPFTNLGLSARGHGRPR